MARKPTIWIIDDSPTLGRTFALALAAAGYEAEALEDLSAAEARMASGKPDALIVDNNGPERWVSRVADSPLSGIPLVAVIGPTEAEADLPSAGIAAHTRKPVEVQVLLDAVHKALGGAAPRERLATAGPDKPAKRLGCGAGSAAALAALVGLFLAGWILHAAPPAHAAAAHAASSRANRLAPACQCATSISYPVGSTMYHEVENGQSTAPP